MTYLEPILCTISFKRSLIFCKLINTSNGNHLYLMNLHKISILFNFGRSVGQLKMYRSYFCDWIILDLNNLLLCMGTLSRTIIVFLLIVLLKASRLPIKSMNFTLFLVTRLFLQTLIAYIPIHETDRSI